MRREEIWHRFWRGQILNKASIDRYLVEVVDAGLQISFPDLHDLLRSAPPQLVEHFTEQLVDRAVNSAQVLLSALSNTDSMAGSMPTYVLLDNGEPIPYIVRLRDAHVRDDLGDFLRYGKWAARLGRLSDTRILTGWCAGCRQQQSHAWKFTLGHRVMAAEQTWMFYIPIGNILTALRDEGAIPNESFGYIVGLCPGCFSNCTSCGSHPVPTNYDQADIRSRAEARLCLICTGGNLLSVVPPKPDRKELRMYRSKFNKL